MLKNVSKYVRDKKKDKRDENVLLKIVFLAF